MTPDFPYLIIPERELPEVEAAVLRVVKDKQWFYHTVFAALCIYGCAKLPSDVQEVMKGKIPVPLSSGALLSAGWLAIRRDNERKKRMEYIGTFASLEPDHTFRLLAQLTAELPASYRHRLMKLGNEVLSDSYLSYWKELQNNCESESTCGWISGIGIPGTATPARLASLLPQCWKDQTSNEALTEKQS